MSTNLVNLIFDDNRVWLPYAEVKLFLNYGATQMWTVSKKLTVSKIGNRKFILKASLIKLLEKSIVN